MNTNLINTMVLASNKAINDHDGKMDELAGVCLLANGLLGAIPATDKAFCINELYVGKDGMAHISTRSISGTVMPWYDLATQEGIKEFNDTLTFDSNKITKVIFIKVINA